MAGVSDVTVCNLALGHLKKNRIQSLGEGGENATACNDFYDQVVEEVLSEHEWSCATKQVKLARLSETPISGYSYKYELPADFLEMRKVYEGYEWERHGNEILTDAESCTIKYTGRVLESRMDRLLIGAIGFKLAWYMALRLTGKKAVKDDMGEQYLYTIGLAMGSDAVTSSGEDSFAGSKLWANEGR